MPAQAGSLGSIPGATQGLCIASGPGRLYTTVIARISKYLSAALLSAMPVVLEAQAILEGQVLSGRTRAAVLGANIVVRGTDEGGASDSKGQFRFTTTSSYPLTLDITHIAYKPLEVIVANDTTLILLLTPTHIMGEGVLVTAPHSRAAADIRSAVEIVTAEAMESLGARDVGDVLRPLPSVTISVSATGKQTVSIRGSNANEVAIFLDGLRLNDANSGVADLSSIDMNDLERVEVIKGGATTLFGSGAFGGVISMTSRRPDSNQVSIYRGASQARRDDTTATCCI